MSRYKNEFSRVPKEVADNPDPKVRAQYYLRLVTNTGHFDAKVRQEMARTWAIADGDRKAAECCIVPAADLPEPKAVIATFRTKDGSRIRSLSHAGIWIAGTSGSDFVTLRMSSKSKAEETARKYNLMVEFSEE